MNANSSATTKAHTNTKVLANGARAIALVLVLVAAAAAGLFVGNALQQGENSLVSRETAWEQYQAQITAVPAANRFGYPAGYQGGAAATQSRTAKAVFSLEAIEQLQAIRGNGQVGSGQGTSDHTHPGTITTPTPR